MHAITVRLAKLVSDFGWAEPFQQALDAVAAQRIDALTGITTLDQFLGYVDALAGWAPREAGDSRLVQDKLTEFYFVLDQPPLKALQSAVTPSAAHSALTPLSEWIVDFARAWGRHLDEPASAVHVDTFRTNPAFRWDDYMPPPSGYLTFNQFFARHVKPGRRPVSGYGDNSVVVSPVDASFIGQWRIGADSTIDTDSPAIDAKGLRWSIQDLLKDSSYAERFAGGVFMHCALRTFDYHRWHSPVAGRVLETRIIQGQSSLDVDVIETDSPSGGAPGRALHAVERTGYQFVQTRGLVVLKSPIGLVVCLPVGMAQVSSVVITAEPGAVLRKGEEMGYFQFGGSDFVMVFEHGSEIQLACEPDEHCLQGQQIGVAAVLPWA